MASRGWGREAQRGLGSWPPPLPDSHQGGPVIPGIPSFSAQVLWEPGSLSTPRRSPSPAAVSGCTSKKASKRGLPGPPSRIQRPLRSTGPSRWGAGLELDPGEPRAKPHRLFLRPLPSARLSSPKGPRLRHQPLTLPGARRGRECCGGADQPSALGSPVWESVGPVGRRPPSFLG